eukprot:NODE_250_length_11764_cov_1.155594.p5 type:complete len:136 gc:universal NODE_250_length_11764_cov_1.155594:9425-9832(+)
MDTRHSKNIRNRLIKGQCATTTKNGNGFVVLKHHNYASPISILPASNQHFVAIQLSSQTLFVDLYIPPSLKTPENREKLEPLLFQLHQLGQQFQNIIFSGDVNIHFNTGTSKNCITVLILSILLPDTSYNKVPGY